jgi:aspartate racemase
MKTIGVLGGIGPQATMDFEARVHRVSHALIPQKLNLGYPPMVVAYHRSPPFVMKDDMTPRMPVEPAPSLLEAAWMLGAVSDFLVITANAPHLFQEQIEAAAGRKVLSMVKLALDEIQAKGWKKVGVLGFGDPTVYSGPLTALGIAHEVLAGDIRDRLDNEIIAVWEGRDNKESCAVAQYSTDALRRRGADGVVLGCTEVPLLLERRADATDLINPIQLLAEAAVREAIGQPIASK